MEWEASNVLQEEEGQMVEPKQARRCAVMWNYIMLGPSVFSFQDDGSKNEEMDLFNCVSDCF